MPADALRKKFRAHLAELEQREASRYIDLAVAWERKTTGEQLGYFGGVWDQVEQRFMPGRDPERCVVIRFNESQIELAQWAAWYAQERADGRPRDFINLFAIGDRGSGKTYAAVAILGTLQVAFPYLGPDASIAWVVSRSHQDSDEIDRTFRAIFPSSWYSHKSHPTYRYDWVTGARITNASGKAVEGLRARGRVDFLVLNEAGLVGREVPFNATPRIKDRGGLAILTANPPNPTGSAKAQWILDLHEKAEEHKQKGTPYHTRFVWIRSSGNENSDRATGDLVAQYLYDLDPRAAKADVEGLLLPIGDRAYYRWSKLTHLRPTPHLGDITREFTRRRLGREYDYVGGVDFQGTPHHAAVICKIYGTLADPILWVVDDFAAEKSTEDDLLDLVDEAGYTPETLAWVGDASGQWQDGAHNRNGRDSFAVFRARRWRIEPPAQKLSAKGKYSKNPPVEKRVSLVNRLLGDTENPQAPVRLFVDPGTEKHPRCRKIAEALKECLWVKARYGGKPAGYYSHLSDALGYVCWFIYPAPQRARTDGPLALIGERSAPSLFG